MENIIISTDFSASAAHAAAYGYNMAKQLKANVLLANAVMVPALMPQAGGIVWPMEESDVLVNTSTDELQKLKFHLEQNDYSDTFRPVVDYVNDIGTVTDVVGETMVNNADLVIIAKHAGNMPDTFLLGNHCHNLIDTTHKPLLVIPPEAVIKPIKKIAFATDLYRYKKDLSCIFYLIHMARDLNADILITHVDTKSNHPRALQLMADQLLTELSNKANYPHIYYRTLKDNSAENGLDWLCEHGNIDILAMNHGAYNFLDDVLHLSHTQNMAAHIKIPLLVFPAV